MEEAVGGKLLAILVIFLAALAGGLLPLKIRSFKGSDLILSFANAFAGGVFLAAGLGHILPEAVETFQDELKHIRYPVPYVLCGIGFLACFFIEQIVANKWGQQMASKSGGSGLASNFYEASSGSHSHGEAKEEEHHHHDTGHHTQKPKKKKKHRSSPPTGAHDDHQSLLRGESPMRPRDDVEIEMSAIPVTSRPATSSGHRPRTRSLNDGTSTPAEESSVRERSGSAGEAPHAAPAHTNCDHAASGGSGVVSGVLEIDLCEVSSSTPELETAVPVPKLNQVLFRASAVVLILVLSTHALVEGVALGAQNNVHGAGIIFIAIFSHKSISAFAFGASMIKADLPLTMYLGVLVVFAMTTPLGAFLGMLLSTGSKSTSNIITAVVSSLCAGTFTYVATIELQQEFKTFRIPKFAVVCVGFTIMNALALVDT